MEVEVTQPAKQIDTSAAAESTNRDALWPNYAPPQDLVFTHGRGSELFTAEGDAYLDFLSGIAVTAFGHAHPHLIQALAEQHQTTAEALILNSI